MGSISLRNVSLTASVPLFRDLNLVIADGDRVGLVAGNGNGKTSLLRCIAGQAEPSGGDIVCSRGLQIGYVKQDVPKHLLDLTLHESVRQALPPEVRDFESWRADVALDDFQTPDELRQRQVRALSGGWQRLLLIARIWVNQPDALLLDEPTNHLDLGKLYQLEAWLNASTRNMPVIVASHDREFLDACTNRTLFLRPEQSRYFALPFSEARRALAEEDAADASKAERELKEAKQLRRQAAKLTNIGINSGSDLLTVKAKYLKERAARIEAATTAVHREQSGDIRLANSGTHAKVLLALDDIEVATPAGEPLFQTGRMHVFLGDRIVLLGRNGSGKSQFVRLLHVAITGGEVPGVKVTPSVALGYLDQEMSQLDSRRTPAEIIGHYGVGDGRGRALLAAAGFPIERQGQPVAQLSPGQKARLGLLALRLSAPNFYLLDEPTNHVDIAGRERLEEELLTQEATSILVSHDRSFIRNVGTRFLLIEGRRLREIEGPEAWLQEVAQLQL
ncbi:MAG TPA: ABC-F family ATP-binding cassette domain-containing protein [Devosiaceae bacterium]|jgi:ATPase subunit of ABC transporter with duplicated ATPase domains|nr:ABC-F family ATP-binding cassette domain-containing protein [Devosiaceae bacterium]